MLNLFLTASYSIFPADSAATIIGGLMSVIGDNITPILTLLGLTTGIFFVTRMLNKAKKGKV
mgnify:CR=1 FL=1